MFYNFEKWHGCRNDFIVLFFEDTSDLKVLNQLAKPLCSRIGDGIGADGILAICKNNDKYQLFIINSDGSAAQTCGNGIRCAAQFIRKHHTEDPSAPLNFLDISLQNGSITRCHFSANSDLFVFVSMGKAKELQLDNDLKKILDNLDKQFNLDLMGNYGHFEILNNHIIFEPGGEIGDNTRKLGIPLQTYGDGINVHIVESIPLTEKEQQKAFNESGIEIEQHFKAASYERGAGETMACGSGACAIACYGYLNSPLNTGWSAIDMPGGRLYVGKKGESMTLLGPASYVFSGRFEDKFP